MNIFIYTLIWLIPFLVIIKDIIRDFKNYLKIYAVGFIVAVVIENLMIRYGFLTHNLPLKLLGIPLVVYLLYIFYFSFVYRIAKLAKNKNLFYLLVFISSALLGFLFDISAINFGYWQHLLDSEIFNVSVLAPLGEGIMFLIIFLIFGSIKPNSKNK